MSEMVQINREKLDEMMRKMAQQEHDLQEIYRVHEEAHLKLREQKILRKEGESEKAYKKRSTHLVSRLVSQLATKAPALMLGNAEVIQDIPIVSALLGLKGSFIRVHEIISKYKPDDNVRRIEG